MNMCTLKEFLLPLLIVFLVMSLDSGVCNGRRHNLRSSKTEASLSSSPSAQIFNVLDFGAKGNGVNDDTKAFEATWASACKVAASTVIIPSGYQFLVGPVSFIGPCQPNLVFQLNGTIIAPTSPEVWGSGLLQWLEFKNLVGIRIQGSGTIEGQEIDSELAGKMPQTRPTALRFYGSYNVTVTGITIQNSPQCHLKFDSCEAVTVFNMSVSSPGDSPNTDGIHLQSSIDVLIHHVNLSCGDDCISIQTGSSNVHVHDINCGPGHGISIGGLGKDKTKACVSNVTVNNAIFSNTMTGVRIKTWQGGSGSVQNIMFSNIKMLEVKTPINIDQFYCDGGHCKNESSAVALSQISYEKIKGTYTYQPVYLACSDKVPCLDISLTDIELEPIQEQGHVNDVFCWEAYGELHAPTIPPVDCLKAEKKMSGRRLYVSDSC